MSPRLPILLIVSSLGVVAFGMSALIRADVLYGESSLPDRQVLWLLLSVPVFILAAKIPYRRFRHLSFPAYVACLLLLIVVLVMPAHHGARRWIPLGLLDFQPSEPARLAFILALAHYLMHRENQRTVSGLVPPLLMTLIPLLLILREPDLGTAMLFLPVLFAMLIAAGARLKHLAIVAACGVALLPLLWTQMSSEQRSRVVTVFRQQDGGSAPSGDGYHLHQSKQVLALNGPAGFDARSPVLPDDPAAWHLPAARTDFIFCIIGERFGTTGCALLIAFYSAIVCCGLLIAAATREPFGRLVAVGITTMLATQAVINMGMTVGLMPITGITLPLVSYGGSSLIATSAALGLLTNIGLRRGYEIHGEPFQFRVAAGKLAAR